VPKAFPCYTLAMQNKLNILAKQAALHAQKLDNLTALEEYKISLLGKKGELTQILKGVGQLSPEERPLIGKLANEVKQKLASIIQEKQNKLEQEQLEQKLLSDNTDITLPSKKIPLGKKHILNQVIEEISDIFQRLGFSIKEGPDIENDFYNFKALNIPDDHPARDMHDTFYLKNNHVMRTHTSPVQIRVMEKSKPPLKFIVPGKVYRCDADVTHSPVFQQVEGLFVDKNVTCSELKGTLSFFLREMFGKDKKVRFRPSYFPFTEPSTEVDVQCVKCKGKGCNLCKQTGWLEILGAGMVNRQVFRYAKYDPDQVTGFAFGMGVERIAMLKYAVHDIRLFYENDIRFLKQF
jgi:phenylalanyl-tRNA synthetase alpha chain